MNDKIIRIKRTDILIQRLLLTIMIFIPLIQLFRMYSLYFRFYAGYENFDTSYFVWIFIPILLGIYIYRIVKKDYVIGIKDYILYVLSLLAIVSTILAVDTKISFWGASGRYEGLLTIIFYYLLILVSSSIKDKKFSFKFLNVFIGIGILQSFYATLQVFLRVDWILGFSLDYMANALCGNPNFYGSLMAMLIPITIGTYLFSSKYNKFYLIISIFFSFAITLSNSFGPLIGLFFGILFLLIIVWKRHRHLLKKGIIITLVCAITSIVSVYAVNSYCVNVLHDNPIPGYTLKNDFDEIFGVIFNKSQSNEIIQNNEIPSAKDNNEITMVSGRKMLWNRSFEMVKGHYWFGIGLDNFATIYAPRYGLYIDKAHNVYLNIFVNNGIIAAVGYIGLLIYILFKGLKHLSNLGIILLSSFVSYVVQAIFNINVTEVVPYFYIICGLILSLTTNENNSL